MSPLPQSSRRVARAPQHAAEVGVVVDKGSEAVESRSSSSGGMGRRWPGAPAPGTGGVWIGAVALVCLAGSAAAEERTEHFDQGPGWEGRNNCATTQAKLTVRQNFGYSPTAHAGGAPGGVGGFITSAAVPACYGRKLEPKTLRDGLTASGRLACRGRPFHVLIGFFNESRRGAAASG
jgi:hypothetical protein